jgi:hypothetical protein
MLGKDIPVEPSIGAGVAGVYTIRIQVKVQNTLGYDVTGGTLFVVPITSNYLVLNAGATSDVLSTVAAEDQVLSARVVGDVQSKELMDSGKNTVTGAASASSRSGNSMAQIMGSLNRSSIDDDPSAMSGAGARGAVGRGMGAHGGGAHQYLGAKRAHYA